MDKDNFKQAFAKLVARTWLDADFKAKLQADPTAVVRETGMELEAGVEAVVVENTDDLYHVVLPTPIPYHEPPEKRLEEEEAYKKSRGDLKRLYEFKRAYKRLITKTQNDAGFKYRLMDDPNGVLEKNGIQLPAGMKAVVLENTERIRHFVVPISPYRDELPVELLETVVGGELG